MQLEARKYRLLVKAAKRRRGLCDLNVNGVEWVLLREMKTNGLITIYNRIGYKFYLPTEKAKLLLLEMKGAG